MQRKIRNVLLGLWVTIHGKLRFTKNAEFIYSLFLEHYENRDIYDHSPMIGSEEYKNTIDYVAFEHGNQKVDITINGNLFGNNAIGVFQNTNVNMPNNQIDFEKVESLLKLISENLQNIGLTESEKKSVSDSIAKIRSGIVTQDSNIIRTSLQFIKDLCINMAGNLMASGIVQQISNLLP